MLVTHHLDVLPRADWIVVMDSEKNEGRIVQQGSYQVRLVAVGKIESTADDPGSCGEAGVVQDACSGLWVGLRKS